MTERITITLPEDLHERIKGELEYGDNRSEWVREAIEMRLDTERKTDQGNQMPAVSS